MKVAALLADRNFESKGQDMFCDSLMSGLVDAFGSANVRHFPDNHPQFMGREDFGTEWPFWLGFGCLAGKPMATFALDEADAYVVNVRWLLDSVRDGLQTDDDQRDMLKQIDPAKTVLIDSSDSPSWMRLHEARQRLSKQPRLYTHRPNPHDTSYMPLIDLTMQVHISVPHHQHVLRMRSRLIEAAPWRPTILAALNDNGPTRHQIMSALACAGLPNTVLCWGSAQGRNIMGTIGPQPPPVYYAMMEQAFACVSCRGGNIDCLRTWEILYHGSLLVTDDFGCADFQHREHCLYYNDANDLIDQLEWALANRDLATSIARRGQALYFAEHTPAQQAARILRKAGLAQ